MFLMLYMYVCMCYYYYLFFAMLLLYFNAFMYVKHNELPCC